MTNARLPAAYLTPGTSSFADFLSTQAPDLLPARRTVPQGHAGDLAPARHHHRRRDVPRRRGDGR